LKIADFGEKKKCRPFAIDLERKGTEEILKSDHQLVLTDSPSFPWIAIFLD
jgi:hypothetical protein